MNRQPFFRVALVGLLASMHCGMVRAASFDATKTWCSEFNIGEELLEQDELEIIREEILGPDDPSLISLSVGQIRDWTDVERRCVDTHDRYLIASFENSQPMIIGVIRFGWALDVRIDTLSGEHILSVFYKTGVKTTVLVMYRFIVGDYGFERLDWVEVEAEGSSRNLITSDLAQIEVHEDRISVRDLVYVEGDYVEGGPNRRVQLRSYRYQGGKVVLMEKRYE